ncbi:hypothetical protein YB2330_000107 [Saitoella coloradoensis]
MSFTDKLKSKLDRASRRISRSLSTGSQVNRSEPASREESPVPEIHVQDMDAPKTPVQEKSGHSYEIGEYDASRSPKPSPLKVHIPESPKTPKTPKKVESESAPVSPVSSSKKRQSFRNFLHRDRTPPPAVPDDEEYERRALEAAHTAPVSPTLLAHSHGIGITSGVAHVYADPETMVEDDAELKRAIALHEAGDLQASAAIFCHLARVAKLPLAQLLYGLSLRHGWGVNEDRERAFDFLKAAAENSAFIEEYAKRAGMESDGKSELSMAFFEMGVSYQQGWGTKKDLIQAKEYFELAAGLGDTDAMLETGKCYDLGIGTKKDRYISAQWYRAAEKKGVKVLGNTWIWKDKYNPPTEEASA